MTTLFTILAIYMFIGYCARTAAIRAYYVYMRLDQKVANEKDPTKTGFFKTIATGIWELLVWPLGVVVIMASGLVLNARPEDRYKVRKQIV